MKKTVCIGPEKTSPSHPCFNGLHRQPSTFQFHPSIYSDCPVSFPSQDFHDLAEKPLRQDEKSVYKRLSAKQNRKLFIYLPRIRSFSIQSLLNTSLTIQEHHQFMKPLIHFIHGKESGPWGTKIRYLADIARRMGYDVESLDYSFTFDPEVRVQLLEESCQKRPAQFFVGSSMGGWVAMTASASIPVRGLFLLAPAIDIPGYPPYRLGCAGDAIEIVHGWQDSLIPVENVIRFSRDKACTLYLVNDEHRLKNRLVQVGDCLESFLKRLG